MSTVFKLPLINCLWWSGRCSNNSQLVEGKFCHHCCQPQQSTTYVTDGLGLVREGCCYKLCFENSTQKERNSDISLALLNVLIWTVLSPLRHNWTWFWISHLLISQIMTSNRLLTFGFHTHMHTYCIYIYTVQYSSYNRMLENERPLICKS